MHGYAFGTPLAEKSKSRANQQADRLHTYSFFVKVLVHEAQRPPRPPPTLSGKVNFNLQGGN